MASETTQILNNLKIPSGIMWLTSSVQSSSSNYKVDSDKILFDIKNIAMMKYKKPLPNEIKMVPTMDIAMIIKTPLSVPVQNVAAYLAGYLLRKVPVDDCQNCANQFALPKLPPAYQDLSVYEFLRNKTCQEAGCLTYPTPSMVIFVENLESVLCHF